MLSNFFICPSCQGRGETNGKICENCGGQAIAAWVGGYLLYFEKKFEKIEAYIRTLKNLFKFIAKIVLIVFGVFGALSLIQAFFRLAYLGNFSYFNKDKNSLLLYFWISVIFDLFLIYFLEREGEEKRKVYPSISREIKFFPQTFDDFRNIRAKDRINVFEALSKEMKKVLIESYRFAYKLGDKEIEPFHLLSVLFSSREVILVMNRLAIDWDKLKEGISSELNKLEKRNSEKIICSLEIKKIFLSAYELAVEKKLLTVGVLEVLEAMVNLKGPVKEIFDDLEIGPDEIKNVCLWVDVYRWLREKSSHFKREAHFKPKGVVNRAYTAVATPYLDTFSQDLTQVARAGYFGICMDREKEMEEIFRIFEGGAQSIVLVGKAGTGKTTIVNGIARRMVTEEVPKFLQDKRLVSLSIANLVAGASGGGEVEERLQMILRDIYRAGNVALFIKDIHNLVGIKTAEGELDISEILADALQKRIFWLISTSNPKDYHRLIEERTLGQVLAKIEINEPDKNTTIQILEANVAGIEAANQVYFSYQAIERAYELSNRYLYERFLPAKAINLLEEVSAYVKNKRGKNSIVTGEDIAVLVSEKTSIPLTKITEEESEKLLNLEERIHQRIIDQEEAVKMVSSALRRARVELRSMKRPIANLLFLGPTGVGKTELAKTVAEVYFGNEKNMIRFDMSEYQNKADIARLIGSPDGSYEGLLSSAVIRSPFSLLLLDEIEKAHPDILNIFLQVMDDGRLTDATGRLVDFTNIILIGTSNAGTDFIQEEIQKNTPIKMIQEVLVREKLKSYFKPEFLNRFDGIIVFEPLGKEEIRQITYLLLKKTEKQLETKGIRLEITEGAVDELAEAGFDPIFGARSLARVIQERVSDALSKYLLTGKLSRKDTAILKEGGEIEIKNKK